MRAQWILAAGMVLALAVTGCSSGPSPEENAATTSAIGEALDQIAAEGGDQITQVSVQLRAAEPILSALVANPEQEQRVTIDRDGLRSESRGSVVGQPRAAADWRQVDFVGFAADLKCPEPILVTATASQEGQLLVAECEDAALRVELDGTALPVLTDYTAEGTWQTFLAEAGAMVDLTRVTRVALWGDGSLDGRPWFMISGMAIGSRGGECEMQWSRKPDPLDDGDHTVPPAQLAGCTGINANPVTFDLSKVAPAEFAAAVSDAAAQVGREPGEAMLFSTEAAAGQLVMSASWGVGAAGKVDIVVSEQAP